jgi:hypothetical protein
MTTVGPGLFCQEKHCDAEAVTSRTIDRAGGENTWVFAVCQQHADQIDADRGGVLVEKEADEEPVLVLDR